MDGGSVLQHDTDAGGRVDGGGETEGIGCVCGRRSARGGGGADGMQDDVEDARGLGEGGVDVEVGDAEWGEEEIEMGGGEGLGDGDGERGRWRRVERGEEG